MDFVKTYLLIIITIFGYVSHVTNGKQLLCGKYYQPYNPLTEECVRGQVYNSTTAPKTRFTPTTQKSIHVTTQATQVQEPKPDLNFSRTCRDNADFLTCNKNIYCGRSQGYRCCGFEVYHPKRQTCCRQTSAEYKIHDGKPEETHMCCELQVYDRGSPNVTCQHAAANDKFFRRPSRIRKDQRICRGAMYAFHIEIKEQKKRNRYITAEVKMWAWPPITRCGNFRMRKSPIHQKEMVIKLDRHTPKKDITRKAFVIFSTYNYLKDIS